MKYSVPVLRSVPARKQGFYLVAFALLIFSTIESIADTTRTVHDIAPGITLSQEITTGVHPLIVHYLRVDLRAKSIHVRSGQALDAVTLNGPHKGREPLHLARGVAMAQFAV